MKTVKTYCVVAGAVTLLSASNLFASIGSGTVKITAPGFTSTGDVNGPYTAQTITVASGPNLGNFETFCLGYTVDYVPGATYNYQISTTVQPQASGGGSGYSYVSMGTAYLYNQYRLGAIGSGSANDSVNDALQEAIWKLQGQSAPYSTGSSTSDASYYVGLAEAALASAYAPANGAYGVYALNLTPGSTDGYAQPQLCQVVPEPSTVIAGALLLLPFGLSTARVLRKNKA